jgi:CheY-like chemotaxis protein/HPt (histidine-containing phosphotransfer) domain-containing protein
MGGSISVTSAPNQGSCFEFSVILEQQDYQEIELVPLDLLDSLKCLVVDDNEMAREVFKKMLQSFGFQVWAVASAHEAFLELHRAQKHSEKPYDVVLMDYQMPHENGLEAANKIKADKSLQIIPLVIMVTAHDRETIRKEWGEKALDGLLIKPISAETMLSCILLACGKEIATKTINQEKAILRTQRHYAGVKILLVEDNPTNQQVGLGILTSVGALVDIANNGVEAIQKAGNKQLYDVILMDLQMPEMDGFKATEFIRANYPHYDHVPIIAMTANVMKNDREKCLQAGMNDHIAKPIDVSILFSVLDKWLEIESNEARLDLETASEQLPQFPQLPGIDIKSGLQRLSGNCELFKRVICGFYQDHQPMLVKLKQAVEQNSWEEVQEYVHQIKGSAGNISALNLAECAKTIEYQLKQGDYTFISENIRQLEQLFLEIGLAVQILAGWNKEKTDLKEKTALKNIDEKLLKWQLAQLKILLLSNDLRAEILFNNIYPLLNFFINKDILQKIQKDVINLAYNEAQNKIEVYINPALAKLKNNRHDLH